MPSDESHKVVELNDGKAVYSDKGLYYLNKRDHPKSGIRKASPNDQSNFRDGMDNIFGEPTCDECGADMLIRNRKLCDTCRKP